MSNADDPWGNGGNDGQDNHAVYGGGDPYAENPDAEFAPTQAMTAIPFPPTADGPGGPSGPPSAGPGGPGVGPGGPRGPGAGPNFGPGPGSRPSPASVMPDEEKKFGPSSIISLVGALILVIAFFVPTFGGAYLTEDFADGSGILGPAVVLESEEAPEGMEDEFEVSRDFLETIGFDDMWEVYRDGDEAEIKNALREYGISMWQLTRMMQILDFNADVIDVGSSDQQAFRVFWMTCAMMLVAGMLAIGLAIGRGFKPLNAFQVAWAGTWGLQFLLLGLVLVIGGPEETKKINDMQVAFTAGPGGLMILIGGLILWISAFAGLSKTNWWKAPLIGLAITIATGGVIILPALMV